MRLVLLIMFFFPLALTAHPVTPPLDVYPAYDDLKVEGDGVYLSAEAFLDGGVWEGWSRPRWEGEPHGYENETCPIPDSHRTIEGGQSYVVLCEDKRTWFAAGSYCWEGTGPDRSLYVWDRVNHHVQRYEGVLDECQRIARALHVGHSIWFTTFSDGGEDRGVDEAVHVLDLTDGSVSKPKGFQPQHDDAWLGHVSYGLMDIAYHPASDTLWLLYLDGLEFIRRATGERQRRYFSLEIDEGAISVGLSVTPMPVDEMWAYRALEWLPIREQAEFIEQWKKHNPENQTQHIAEPLWPFYIEALRIMDERAVNEFSAIILLQRLVDSGATVSNALGSALLELFEQRANWWTRSRMLKRYPHEGGVYAGLKAIHLQRAKHEYYHGDLDWQRYGELVGSLPDLAERWVEWSPESAERTRRLLEWIFKHVALSTTEADGLRINALASEATDLVVSVCNGISQGEQRASPELVDAVFMAYRRLHRQRDPLSHRCSFALHAGVADKRHMQQLYALSDTYPEEGAELMSAANRIAPFRFSRVKDWRRWWEISAQTITDNQLGPGRYRDLAPISLAGGGIIGVSSHLVDSRTGRTVDPNCDRLREGKVLPLPVDDKKVQIPPCGEQGY